MASSSGMAVLISLVRLASSFSLPATGKVPTFFGCSKFCSDDRRRSSHEFADLAHPGRCISYAVFCLKKKIAIIHTSFLSSSSSLLLLQLLDHLFYRHLNLHRDRY